MLSILGYSQQIMITGKVVIDNSDEQIDPKSIVISNLNSDAKTKVNSYGVFSILVSVNDVLTFSGDHVEKREIKISENIIKKGFVEIHLDVETIELAEANINPLKKNFKANVSNEDSETTNNYKNWGLNPNLQYIEVNPNMTSSLNNNGFLDPALWISKATGKFKKDKKQNEYFIQMTTKDEIINHFTETYFVDELKIPNYKIKEFLNYCSAKTNIVNLFKQLNYEAVESHIINCASNYLQLLNQK